MVEQSKLEMYADLAIRVGVNLQPGQILVIGQDTLPVPIEYFEFVRYVTQKAYAAGARQVYVNWEDPELNRIRLESASDYSLDEYPQWKVNWMESMLAEGAAFLAIFLPHPDLMTGIDPARVARAAKAKANALRNFMSEYVSLKTNYCILSVPSKSWAKKLFPALSDVDAMNKLWDIVLEIVRIDTDNPFQEWETHVSELGKKTRLLNDYGFTKLRYSAPGTDLTVDLPEEHQWISLATVKNKNNVPFLPNLPSEEVFTAPHRTGVNGTLRSTMPLYYGGTMINNIQLTMSEGKIVNYSADEGLATLKGIIESDEGSSYLGEIALVPITSPVAKHGILFMNPLYDENASCHFAIGNAYPSSIVNGQSMSPEERLERGLNQSITHVDFMVGSNELNIDGETKDGRRIPILSAGNWVL
ncbi:aminopeptidase [Paenibacillus frigoriresistens]|uniref:aminopeptidase n=1 Tax=Paenibacillus alginolyticus TaxID=59839 RepID=UPI001565DABD|nr:aminopeptidase [Paenibacillus frigoriresistens]NRF94352.1 aminopeptidase [Paenibacillus frigoriresistens]